MRPCRRASPPTAPRPRSASRAAAAPRPEPAGARRRPSAGDEGGVRGARLATHIHTRTSRSERVDSAMRRRREFSSRTVSALLAAAALAAPSTISSTVSRSSALSRSTASRGSGESGESGERGGEDKGGGGGGRGGAVGVSPERSAAATMVLASCWTGVRDTPPAPVAAPCRRLRPAWAAAWRALGMCSVGVGRLEVVERRGLAVGAGAGAGCRSLNRSRSSQGGGALSWRLA